MFSHFATHKMPENDVQKYFSERLQNKMFFAGGYKGSGSLFDKGESSAR